MQKAQLKDHLQTSLKTKSCLVANHHQDASPEWGTNVRSTSIQRRHFDAKVSSMPVGMHGMPTVLPLPVGAETNIFWSLKQTGSSSLWILLKYEKVKHRRKHAGSLDVACTPTL